MNLKKIFSVATIGLILSSSFISIIQPISVYAASGKSQTETKDVQKTLDSYGNLYGSDKKISSLAESFKSDILPYDKKMQVLITYSILKNKYGDGTDYSTIYDKPEKLINSFNKVSDWKIPTDYGNKTALDKATKAAGSTKTTNDNGSITKGEEITAMLPGKDGQGNKLTAEQKVLNDVAIKAAENIAQNVATATEVSSSRKVTAQSIASGNTDNPLDNIGQWTGDTWHGITSGNLNQANPGSAMEAIFSDKTHLNDLTVSKGSVPTKLKQYIAGALIDAASKKTNEKDVIKVFETSTGFSIPDKENIYQTSAYNKKLVGKQLKNYGFSMDGEKSTTNDNKDNAKAQSMTEYLTPIVQGINKSDDGLAGYVTDWDKHYKKYMSKESSYKVSSNDKKIIKSFINKKKTHTDSQEKTIGDTKGIAWNWIAPKSEAFNNTKSGNFITSDDHVSFVGSEKHYIAWSPSVIYKTGSMGKLITEFDNGGFLNVGNNNHAGQKPVYWSLGGLGNAEGSLKNDEPLSNMVKDMHNGSNQQQIAKYQKIVESNSPELAKIKNSSTDVMGFDSYGNLIDGQNLAVIVPYWQNDSVKSLSGLGYGSSSLINSSSKFDYSSLNEKNIKNETVASFLGDKDKKTKAYSNATAVSKSLNKAKSGSDIVKAANTAVNSDSKSKLSDSGAAALAILISSGSSNLVKNYNSQFLSDSVKGSSLYISKSTTETEKNIEKKSSKGTYLYTATDIIQREGLATDFGSWDGIRKTIVSALVSTYNNSFLQGGTQDIFYTKTSSDTGLLNNSGFGIYYIIVILVSLSWIVLLVRRYYLKDSKVKAGSFFSILIKIIGLVVILAFNPSMDQLFLNKPAQIMINKPLKQQSVLDQWSKVRQQESLNNVFYSSLFGDMFGQINKSGSYNLKFYTTTLQNNSVNEMNGKDPKDTKPDANTDSQSLQDKVASLSGNGIVAPLSPFKYKTVNISSSDLMSWAIHMYRQEMTAKGADGFKQGENSSGEKATETGYEAPNAGYDPGKVSLFVWLDKFYVPLGENAKTVNNKGSETSESSGAQFGSGDSAYSKRRNPADTSPKSAYRSGNSTTNANDNGEQYRGLSKLTEYKVNTKHYAEDKDKQYNLDVDSNGSLVSASDLFYKIWSTTFVQKNANVAGQESSENYLALMKVAQAINGQMGDQTTTGDTEAGNGVNIQTIGSVGRKSLLNELSMTKVQREALNGSGQYSKAASDVINSFGIKAPTDDYLALDANDSPLDLIHPYWGKKQDSVRDKIIYDTNKKFLNDYINIYSQVRAEIQPENADSTGANNQQDGTEVDEFSMAESQIMALDLFFTLNKTTGQKMFPTGYLPDSISLDTWNRMLFIPIGALKNQVDSSQYNTDDKMNPSTVQMQDNVAEYIGTNSSIPSLIFFILMNIILVIFGMLLSLFISILYPLWLAMSLFRAFFKVGNTTFKSIFFGALGIKLLAGAMKFLLVGAYSLLSSIMNNQYLTSGGKAQIPVMKNSLLISAIVIIFFFVWYSFFTAMKGDFFNFGMGNGVKGFGRNFGGNISRANPLTKTLNKISHIGRRSDRTGKKHRFGTSINSIANHISNIRRRTKSGTKFTKSIMNDLKDRKFISAKNKLKDAFIKGKNNFASRIGDLKNSGYGEIEPAISNGLSKEKLGQTANGDKIDTINQGNLELGIGKLADVADSLKDLIKDNKITNAKLVKDNQGNYKVMLDNLNDKMLESAEGRKEATQNLYNSAMNAYRALEKLPSGMIQTIDKTMGIAAKGNMMNVPISKQFGVNPKNLQKMIADQDFVQDFSVISTPVQDANGNFANGPLQLRYNGQNAQQGYRQLERLANKYASHNVRQRYDSSLQVGADNAVRLANATAGMVAAGDRILFDSNNQQQVLAAQSMSNRIGGKVNAKKHSLNQFLNATSDWVQTGNGFATQAFVSHESPNQITERFRTTNPQNVADAINGLTNIAKANPNALNTSLQLENQLNDEIVKSYGSPVSAANNIYSLLSKQNMLNDNDLAHIKNLRNLQQTMGPGMYENASPELKTKMSNEYNALLDSLGQNGKLQMVQNSLINNSNDQELRRTANNVSKQREQMIKSSNVNGEIFNRMSLGQMASMIGRTSGMTSTSIDSNGVLQTNLNKTMDVKTANKDLSTLIRLVS